MDEVFLFIKIHSDGKIYPSPSCLLSSLFFLFVFSSMQQQVFTYILGYILKELLCDRMAPVHLKSGSA